MIISSFVLKQLEVIAFYNFIIIYSCLLIFFDFFQPPWTLFGHYFFNKYI